MRFLLMFLLLFQSIGAMGGGLVLMISPSGELMGMPLSHLDHSPFTSFFIPGLFLFLVLGVIPMVTTYGLLKRPSWKLFELLNFHQDQHWSWTFSFYIGIILILWIDIQVTMIRQFDLLHLIYSLLGVVIVVVSQFPPVRNFYSKGTQEN
jgi:hypothetical protein